MRTDSKDKILDAAMELAASGGFENVRQRDVAAGAGIALGTLYKRFRSKEDILAALLDREALVFERRLAKRPPAGETTSERLHSYYQAVTRTLLRKPHLARAMLRAMTAGDEHTAENVSIYHNRMVRLVLRAMRGADSSSRDRRPTDDELKAASLLQHIWFSALVAWAAGFNSQRQVVALMDESTAVILGGLPSIGA